MFNRFNSLFTRLTICLLALAVLITTACSETSVVGKWKVSRTYDHDRKTWNPVPNEALLELTSDGKFMMTPPMGPVRNGEYQIDEGVTPHRFTATEQGGRSFRGIYKVEGGKLTVRGALSDEDLEFPQSIDPSQDKSTYPTIELERKK
jgi:uncharacterized protein (TIGR03067 family)